MKNRATHEPGNLMSSPSSLGVLLGSAVPSSRSIALIGSPIPSSRSDALTVAVGFSPRSPVARPRVAERRLNPSPTPDFPHLPIMRRSATPSHSVTQPWIEIHGYRHGLAPRGGMAHTTRLPHSTHFLVFA